MLQKTVGVAMGRWCPNGQICGRASVSKLTYGETSNFSCVGLKENPLNQSHVWRLCCHQKIQKKSQNIPFLHHPKKKHHSVFQLPIASLIHIFTTHRCSLFFFLFCNPHWIWGITRGNPRLTSSSAGSPLSRFLSHYFNIQVGDPARGQCFGRLATKGRHEQKLWKMRMMLTLLESCMTSRALSSRSKWGRNFCIGETSEVGKGKHYKELDFWATWT